MEEKIVININSLGELNAETFGINGSKCLTELDKLMKDVARGVHIDKKLEFFDEKTSVDNSIKVKNHD